jgi:hypothetical protein
MKHSIIALLAAGLCAGSATASFAQNVTADPKAAETTKSRGADQKEMTNPPKGEHTGGTHKRMHDKGDAAFKKADKDKDGTLDRAEAKAMPKVSKNFDAIDVDKDGTVSREEIHTYMKGRHAASNN